MKKILLIVIFISIAFTVVRPDNFIDSDIVLSNTDQIFENYSNIGPIFNDKTTSLYNDLLSGRLKGLEEFSSPTHTNNYYPKIYTDGDYLIIIETHKIIEDYITKSIDYNFLIYDSLKKKTYTSTFKMADYSGGRWYINGLHDEYPISTIDSQKFKMHDGKLYVKFSRENSSRIPYSRAIYQYDLENNSWKLVAENKNKNCQFFDFAFYEDFLYTRERYVDVCARDGGWFCTTDLSNSFMNKLRCHTYKTSI